MVESRTLSEVSDAELGDVLRAAVEAESVAKAAQVAAIQELERRGTWREDGMRVLSDWVALTTNQSAASARRVTAAARRLSELPLVTKALAEGVLSWDQVVPLSRLAGDDEGYWLSVAQHCSPEQLSALAARRKAPEPDEKTASCKWQRDDEGWLSYWGRCQGDDADRFESTMERLIDRETSSLPGEGRKPYDERAAEAMAILMSLGLEDMPRHDRATVNVHVDFDLLSGTFGQPVLGSDVALSSPIFERLCCDGRIRLIFDDRDGNPRAWTEARSPAWPLEEAVRRRDVHCIWPGCRRRCGQVHHIVWASRCGKTIYSNMVLLCWHHHRLVHEGGWSLTGVAGDVTITRPNGKVFAAGVGPPGRLA